MNTYRLLLGCLSVIGFAVLLFILTRGSSFPLLFPSGSIGVGERDLMVRATLLMLIVVVPVILLAIFIAWHYREGNTTAAYTPNWEHSKLEELVWWSIPLEIVLVLAALTWTSTHELDPIKHIPSEQPPYVIQVVALPWKWLFIYPEDGIASVNEVALPVGRSVEFDITADAPMNSFWIPALGGQMYAMTGMTTILHLEATTAGDYPGMSANYSGEGFAQMKFTARALSADDFQTWVETARKSQDVLSKTTYASLRTPSMTGPVRYYSKVDMPFADILSSYMPEMKVDTPSMTDMMHH